MVVDGNATYLWVNTALRSGDLDSCDAWFTQDYRTRSALTVSLPLAWNPVCTCYSATNLLSEDHSIATAES